MKPKLRERALQDNVSHEVLLKLGITKEHYGKGAALLEKAGGQSSSQKQHYAQEVRWLQYENRNLKAHLPKKHVAAVVLTNVSKGKSGLQLGRNVQTAKKWTTMPKHVDQDHTRENNLLAIYQVKVKVTLKNHQEG